MRLRYRWRTPVAWVVLIVAGAYLGDLAGRVMLPAMGLNAPTYWRWLVLVGVLFVAYNGGWSIWSWAHPDPPE